MHRESKISVVSTVFFILNFSDVMWKPIIGLSAQLPNFIPRGGLALPDLPGLFKKSSFKMADSQRIVRVKTPTKAFFFEETVRIFLNLVRKGYSISVMP